MVLRAKRSKLNTLAEDLTGLERSIRELEEKHEAIFTLHREYLDEKEGLVDKIKTEARRLATIGEATVLIEQPDLFVSVVGKKPSVSYDYERAYNHWPSQVLEEVTVRTIDAKKVNDMILEGRLNITLADKIKKETPQTAAVTVKLP
jgi:chromosome segregation ATPase